MSRWCPIDDPYLSRWNALQNPAIQHEDNAPLKLHVNKPVPLARKDLLTGQDYSGQFYRYIDLAFQQAKAKDAGRVNWWHLPYVLARISQDESINRRHLLALLAFRVGGMSWQTTLDTYQCGAQHLKRLERTIIRAYMHK